MRSFDVRSWAIPALTLICMSLSGCLDAERTYFARQPISLHDLDPHAAAPTDPHSAAPTENTWQVSATDFSWPRFPARLAVARVIVSTQPVAPGAARLMLDPLTPVEKPAWIECLRDIIEVSELYFLQAEDFPRRPLSSTDIANRAAQQNARLCLVFGQSDLGNRSAEVVGTLIDTRSLETIATLRSHAEPSLHGFEVDRPKNRPESDDRHSRPSRQAEESFRQLLHTCVLDLISREQMAAANRTAAPPDTRS
jgi:hypothetical protein